MQMYPLDASLTLAEAGPKWLLEHSRILKSNTIRSRQSKQRRETASPRRGVVVFFSGSTSIPGRS